MDNLKKITRTALNLVLCLSAVILTSSVVFYAFNSLLRFLKMPMPWPEEYCTYVVVVMVFLLQCKLEFDNDELTINALDRIAEKRPALNTALYLLRYLVTGGIYLILISVGVKVIHQNFMYKAVTPVMKVSMGVYFSLVVLCFVLALVTMAIRLLLTLGKRGTEHG